MKRCGKCKLVLPVESFSRNRSQKDGWHDWCKKCHKEYADNYYAAHRKERVAYSQKWCELNRARSNAIKYSWVERHLEQRKSIQSAYYQKSKDRKYEGVKARRFIKKNLLSWFEETGRTIQKPKETQECPSCGVLTLPSGLLIFDGHILCCWCVEDVHKTQPYKRPPIVYKKCPNCGRQTLDLKDGICPDCRIRKKAAMMDFVIRESELSNLQWRSRQKNLR